MKCTDVSNVRRATQKNIQNAATRVANHLQQNNLNIGRLQTQYANITTARLPENAPVEIPTNVTMAQLGHIDRLAEHHAQRNEERDLESRSSYRRVRIRIGAITSGPLDCYVSVEDLKLVLGLPQFDLVPAISARPPLQTAPPMQNIDDVDHIDL